jgi:hypothetical protein
MGYWEPWGWNGSIWGWGIANENTPILTGAYGELAFRSLNGIGRGRRLGHRLGLCLDADHCSDSGFGLCLCLCLGLCLGLCLWLGLCLRLGLSLRLCLCRVSVSWPWSVFVLCLCLRLCLCLYLCLCLCLGLCVWLLTTVLVLSVFKAKASSAFSMLGVTDAPPSWCPLRHPTGTWGAVLISPLVQHSRSFMGNPNPSPNPDPNPYANPYPKPQPTLALTLTLIRTLTLP